jgi:hypothetical protein
MKLRQFVSALRRHVSRLAMTKGKVEDETHDADDEVSIGPQGPLGPTGGQIGSPQRFS